LPPNSRGNADDNSVVKECSILFVFNISFSKLSKYSLHKS
jgi:hypothetical protein